jgi:hypothetical protein
MKQYAITDKGTKEFYPDPVYDSLDKAEAKIAYLVAYELEHNMKIVEWEAEELTGERYKQHETEWNKWVSMID